MARHMCSRSLGQKQIISHTARATQGRPVFALGEILSLQVCTCRHILLYERQDDLFKQSQYESEGDEARKSEYDGEQLSWHRCRRPHQVLPQRDDYHLRWHQAAEGRPLRVSHDSDAAQQSRIRFLAAESHRPDLRWCLCIHIFVSWLSVMRLSASFLRSITGSSSQAEMHTTRPCLWLYAWTGCSCMWLAR